MTVKLVTEPHLQFQMEAVQARLNLPFSRCHVVGNHMSRLNYENKNSNAEQAKTKYAVHTPVQTVSHDALRW